MISRWYIYYGVVDNMARSCLVVDLQDDHKDKDELEGKIVHDVINIYKDLH